MSVSVLDCLGIHEYEIERVYEICQAALDKFEVTEDLLGAVQEDLEEVGSWDDIGNSIIRSMLSTTKAFILRKDYEEHRNHNMEDDITYYVNGLDSHLYICGEEVYAE